MSPERGPYGRDLLLDIALSVVELLELFSSFDKGSPGFSPWLHVAYALEGAVSFAPIFALPCSVAVGL